MPPRVSFFSPDPFDGAGAPDLQQGDVVGPLPFPLFPINAVECLVEGTQKTVDFTEGAPTGVEAVISRCIVLPAMIITQTCDIERRDRNISLCAIRRWVDIYPNQVIGSKAFRERVADMANPGKSPWALALPPYPAWAVMAGYSIADLSLILTLPESNRSQLPKIKRARLSEEGRSLLQERVSNFFGRFAATEGISFSDEDYRSHFGNANK